MSILKNPLLSLRASGPLTKTLTFLRRRGRNLVEKTPTHLDANTAAQQFHRNRFNQAVAWWHLLSETVKQEWESYARPYHLTGYQLFLSRALAPNPNVYLPLQGGTMAGDIDMDSNRVLKLPLPLDQWEAANKRYVDALATAPPTRELWAPATWSYYNSAVSPIRSLGKAPAAQLIAVNDEAAMSFHVPWDFLSLTQAVIMVAPSFTLAAANWKVYSQYAKAGEQYNTHTAQDITTTYNVVATQLFAVNVAPLLTLLQIGDIVSVNIQLAHANHDFYCLGLIIRYSGA